MSGLTIDDQTGAKLPDPQEEVVETSADPERQGIDLSFLKAKTGDGSIEDYMDHPMNFSKSRGLAQIIRGMTGFLGALDLAIIDVVAGFLSFTKERKHVDPVR